MPYKGLQSFKIEEECIKRWVEDLSPTTARNYVYYFLGYLDWARSRGYWRSAKAMLDDYTKLDQKEQFRHLDVVKRYVKSKETGTSDRWNTWCAVRSFYEYHRLPLPKLPRNEASRVFKPSETDKRRALELAPLMLDEIIELIPSILHRRPRPSGLLNCGRIRQEGHAYTRTPYSSRSPTGRALIA